MKITRQDVEKYVAGRPMSEVQVDGIPDGFAFKYADVNIGGKEVLGSLIAYVPLSNWKAVFAQGGDYKKLVELYNKELYAIQRSTTGAPCATASEGWDR